jgi:general secretion pathway protein J
MDIAIMQAIKQHQGFTLLEILIALFVFTILSMMMTGALHTVISAQSGAERSALRLREMQLAQIRIKRDIEQMVNRPVKTASDQDASAFFGSPRGFAFTHGGMAGESSQHQILQRSQYIFGQDGLWRMVWDMLDQTAKSPKPSQRKILDNVTEARFEYMDAKRVFHQDWPVSGAGNQPLPRAVRITLTIKDWGMLKQTYVIPAENATQPPASETQQQAAKAPANPE